jgi:GT2 family glycosyltransferase
VNKIAIVILNWNGRKLLQQFIPSIVQYSSEANIYVADNASTDDSIAFIQSNFPQIKIIQNTDNFGFAKGYNEALKFVEEEIYALVNSDIEVTENWLLPIVQLFESNQKIAIIQPKILDFKDPNKFEYAGAGGGFIDKYGYPFCRGRIFESIEMDNGQYNDTCEVFWASGACFFIRKEVYRKLNGFDDHFFAHQEEIDLCWRAFNDYWITMYCGSSKVYHVGGATLNVGNPNKTFLNFRNSLLMLVKNVPKEKIVSTVFIRLLLDGLASFQFLLKGKPKHFWAVICAHLSFYSMYRSTSQKRVKIVTKKYYQINSIVLSYFVRKIKVYKDLIN